MGCEPIRELISAHLDGELDEAERRLVDEHLAGCTACAAEREGLRRTVGLVKGLPREAAPAALAERIRAALPPAPEAPRPGGRVVPPSRPAIAAAPSPRGKLLTLPRVAAAVAAGLLVGVILQIADIGNEPESTRDEVAIAKEAPLREKAPAAAAETKARQQSMEAETVDHKAASGKLSERKTEADRPEVNAPLKLAKNGQAVPSTVPVPTGAPQPGFDAESAKKGMALRLEPGVPPPPAAQPPAKPAAPRPVAPVAPAESAPEPAPVMARAELKKKPAIDSYAPAPRPATAPPVTDEPGSPPAPPAATAPATTTAAPKRAKAKEPAPAAKAEFVNRLGTAAPAPEKAPDVVLATRSTDIGRDTAILNQLAYGGRAPLSDYARGGLRDKAPKPDATTREGGAGAGMPEARRAAAKAQMGPRPVTLVYDLEPAAAARFMTALAARRDLRVSVVSPVTDEARANALLADAGVRTALERLAAEPKMNDALSMAPTGEENERAARTRSVVDAAQAPAPAPDAPPAPKPAASAAPGGAAPAAGGAPEPPQADPAVQAGPAADAKDAPPSRRVRIVVRLLPR